MHEELAKDIVLQKAQELAAEFPGKSVTLTVCVYHTPGDCPATTLWGVQVGHSASLGAPTYAEAVTKLRAEGSPETKKAKASELRRQADALEAEANTQPPA